MKSIKNFIRIGFLLVVLLFTALASIQLYQQIGNREEQSKLNLYSLVPSSASALLEVRNISQLSRDVFLNLPKSSDFEQKYTVDDFLNLLLNSTDREQSNGVVKNMRLSILKPILRDSLHNSSSLTNKLIISYHPTKKRTHHMFYFKTNNVSESFLTQFVQQNYHTNFQPKINYYRGKKVLVYPLSQNNSYLTVYLGSSYIVFSRHLYLIRKMIDAMNDKNGLLFDPSFKTIYNTKSQNNSIVYVNMKKFQEREQIIKENAHSCLAKWAIFNLELKRDNIYFTGVIKSDKNQKSDLFSVLHSQSHIKTLPTHLLPLSTVYFHHMSISNLNQWEKLSKSTWTPKDKEFCAFLNKYSNHQACDIMMKEDSVHQVVVIPMKKHFNIKQLMSLIPNYKFKENGLGVVSTSNVLDFFSGKNHFELPLPWYIKMVDNNLMCSTSAALLKKYYSQIKENAFLDYNVGYKHVVNQFEVSYQLLVVDCFSQTTVEGKSIVPLIPRSIVRSEILADNYNGALQIDCQEGNAYANIVLASNRDWIPTTVK